MISPYFCDVPLVPKVLPVHLHDADDPKFKQHQKYQQGEKGYRAQ
jgi:hypothetical protein